MKRYEPFAHTADLGLRVWGGNLQELFINAAEGMFSLITDIGKVSPKIRVPIEVVGEDEEELLVNYLNELLFQFEAHGMLYSRFHIDQMDRGKLSGWVEGEEFDPARHEIKAEIKAATYYGLKIEREDGLYKADIIFDV